MDYKNDERYWNINLLNKWFAISSILFLLSIMWMFLKDNDDEFKTYQREFRKIEAQVAQSKLLEELDKVSTERDIYESSYNNAKKEYDSKNNLLDSLNNILVEAKGIFYKSNMDYLFFKAEVDEKKYLYEAEIVESHHNHHDDSGHKPHKYVYKDLYESSLINLSKLKLIKEDDEKNVLVLENEIKNLISDYKK